MVHLDTQKGDITQYTGNAIANAANMNLFGGSGVCGAIFDAAGYDDMTAACRAIGHCEYGEAVITLGFKLPATFVIHTVGPIYGQHDGNEPDILASAYWQSLERADENDLTSIAFPMISTGVYGYPKEEATQIAVETIRNYFKDTPGSHIERVTLYGFTDNDMAVLTKYVQ